ncbi:MAG: hypothetical protein E7465_00245 [Ruminococcaceae bacterium]|nr:hypothetical protein [Oscillospiraceae bacterium]
MKRKMLSPILALCLLLAGCGSVSPPADWDESWTVIAPFLAAEPMEDFTFGESDDILGLSGVYYATWTNGDARPFTNAKGEETVIFSSQIYVVAQECRTESDAQQNIAAWKAREKQNYQILEEFGITLNDRDYIMLTMTSGSEGNPYSFGAAAFTVSGTNAICLELVCSDTFTGSPQALLEEFINGLHFSE